MSLRLCALAVFALSGCEQWSDLKSFFQARPVDDKTALEIDTQPHLGSALKGSVEVDGRPVATQTPHIERPLSPGKHQVRVSAVGHISQQIEIEVKEGEVTPLSLALKQMPTPEADKPRTGSGDHKAKKRDTDKEQADPEDKEPVSHSSRTFIVTATPPQPAYLNGSSLGQATGLRVDVISTSAELRLGGASSGLTFSIANKRTGLRLKVKNLGQRSVMVDGAALSANKGFDIDNRPRRVELVDVSGEKLVVLMKLVD